MKDAAPIILIANAYNRIAADKTDQPIDYANYEKQIRADLLVAKSGIAQKDATLAILAIAEIGALAAHWLNTLQGD